MKERLTLDSKMLEGVKNQINAILQGLTNVAIEMGKESEINLKIKIDVLKGCDVETGKITYEPLFEVKIGNKIKENKQENKYLLGDNFELTRDDNNNLYIKEINEQMSLEEK